MAKRFKYRWGPGFKSEVSLDGDKDLMRKLKRMGEKALGAALDHAADAGMDVSFRAIKADAPGPHIVKMPDDSSNKRGQRSVVVGPDKEHFYYQFIERGVQPFEVDMAKRRTKRSKGGGRKVRGVKAAMSFEGSGGRVVTMRIRRGAVAAKPFMRPNFQPKQAAITSAFGASLKRSAINPELEER